MCVNRGNHGIGRRDFMKVAAAGAIALGIGGAPPVARAAEARRRRFPGEALAALKAGNERYVSHPELCAVDLAASRAAVAAHQAPWATIISCADSRVPPELIFGGHGVGELFVARDAGNLVDMATLGTIEMAPRPRLSAHCHPCPHRLRRGESGLRRGDRERDLSRRDWPDDRADRAGGARVRTTPAISSTTPPRRAPSGPRHDFRREHPCRRSGWRGEGQDRGGDLRPANRRCHLSRLGKRGSSAAPACAARAERGSVRRAVARAQEPAPTRLATSDSFAFR